MAENEAEEELYDQVGCSIVARYHAIEFDCIVDVSRNTAFSVGRNSSVVMSTAPGGVKLLSETMQWHLLWPQQECTAAEMAYRTSAGHALLRIMMTIPAWSLHCVAI